MLTSIQNPKIQWVRALLSEKKERKEHRAFVCEGIRLAEEVIQSHQQPLLALYNSSLLSERGKQLLANCECEKIEIDSSLLGRITATQTSQGLLLVVPFPRFVFPARCDFGIILDDIKDPGNFGTILRAGAAFGLQCVLYTPECVDPYSPKVVRAGMGAHFRLPILEIEPTILEKITTTTQLFLAEMREGIPCWQADLRQPTTFVIGSEATGVSTTFRQLPHQKLCIPMPGGIESLNAAMSATILLYEVLRQRSR